ncbi:hypothetical protein MACJ_003484 [Theileria orientalis]|uniref:Sec16 Sec23-binding domain-containing protein n=1 Tax=Theileria orientalis TaxID=68886 RepID=A0A976SKA5_THEOR|nr:hypothetical protein MACJ_003484 [Theileria orientalis]
MKGFGVFSPSTVTSRYVLVASGLNESSGNGTPRVDASPVSLNLVDFKITEKLERASDPYSDNYDDTTNFNHYSTDAPFSFSGANFDDYMNTISNDGVAEFSLVHSVPFNLSNGHLTTMKWLKLGTPYENDKTLLSVGTNLGDVLFYDADAFVENQSMVSTFTSNVCNVPVKCLGYCGKNMLGVAGLDGQISVVDLTDESNFNVVDVSYGKWKVGLVTSLSWNYRLSHILASSGAALVPSDTSGVVVWDLKVRKPASTFRDPSGRVNPIALDWVPDQPTQLVVGYADDNAPSLQLWDLRNCSAPVTEVKAHTRGLTDLKFSPHDPNMVLTCAKDDTTKCWHLTPEKNFNLLSSIQTEALSHHSRVEWHLNAPGMFLSQANDGELCIHHAFSGKVEDSYMPVWTRKKAGMVTGFAGQVITWTPTDVHNYTLSSHYDSRTEELLNNTLEVLSVLHDEQMFVDFCDSKVANSANEHESLTWSVLRSQYHGEFRDLLDVLGYAEPDRTVSDTSDLLDDNANAVGVTNAQLVGLDTDEDNRTESSNFFTNRSSALTEHTTQDDKDAEDFFNSLTQKTNELDLNASPEPKRVEKPEEMSDGFEPEQISDEEPIDHYIKLNWCSDMSLRRSLVKADHYEAAERCLKLNKVVECLLLGYLGGESVFMEMANKVVKTRKDPFLNLLFMVMHNDVEGFLEYSNLRDWKETLCVLYTYSSDTAYFKELAHRFGRRLQENEMHHESAICFIISGDYREVVEAWRLSAVAEATARTDGSRFSVMGTSRSAASTLEDRLEMLLKLSVLSFSTTASDYASDTEELYENFDAVLMELAEIFVDAGNLEKALETLNVTGASNSEVMTQLKSKIENQILQSQGGEHSSPKLTYHPSTNEHVPYHPEPAVSHHYTPTPSAPVHQPTTQAHQQAGTPVYPTTTPAQAYVSNARTGYQGAPSSYTPVAPTVTTPMTYQHAGLNIGPSVGMSQQMTSAPTRTVPLTAIQSATQSSVQSTHTVTTTVPSSFPTSYATSNATQYSNPTASTNFTPYTLSHSSSNTSYGTAQQGYQPNAPVQQPSAQTYSGVSSAPGAVAGALNPGMPIPWPNPTPTQQMSSTTVSTQQSNKLIIESTQAQPKGEKMGKSDLDMVVSTLHGLVSNLGDSKMDQDNKKNVNELINSLNQGLLSAEANSLLATLCRAVSNGDHFNSNVILGNIISKLWNNQNKPWIMCLKRIVPK